MNREAPAFISSGSPSLGQKSSSGDWRVLPTRSWKIIHSKFGERVIVRSEATSSQLDAEVRTLGAEKSSDKLSKAALLHDLGEAICKYVSHMVRQIEILESSFCRIVAL